MSLVVACGLACGTQPPFCAAAEASACANRVTVVVRDSADASVGSFSGTLTEGGNTQLISCGVASDAGGLRVDCADGGFSFFARSYESASLELSLATTADSGFSGTVPIDWQRATTPPNSCGGHCSTGAARVVVQ